MNENDEEADCSTLWVIEIWPYLILESGARGKGVYLSTSHVKVLTMSIGFASDFSFLLTRIVGGIRRWFMYLNLCLAHVPYTLEIQMEFLASGSPGLWRSMGSQAADEIF